MKVLLGADILIAANEASQEFGSVGWLFQWLDNLKIQKCVDFATFTVLSHFGGINRRIFRNFQIIDKVYRKSPIAKLISSNLNCSVTTKTSKVNESSINALLAQLAILEAGDADFLISDNPSLHTLSKQLNIDDRVYTVSEYVDKCSFEYRELDQSKGLIIEETSFAKLDFNDSFFDSFKQDYPEYETWIKAKANDKVFVSLRQNRVIALLKLKIENSISDFSDINPPLPNQKVLKISSFKIEANRTKLAERFLRLIFNTAVSEKVSGIYVTFFDNYHSKHRLRLLFEKWGFKYWGTKVNSSEIVLFRNFTKNSISSNPRYSYPFHSSSKGIYTVFLDFTYANPLLGINSKYSELNDIEPYKTAISKVLITYNLKKIPKSGSIILFLTESEISKSKRAVAIGIIEDVHFSFNSEATFLRICRKRSIFSDNRLKRCWERQSDYNRISTIEFLYVCPLEETDIIEERFQSAD